MSKKNHILILEVISTIFVMILGTLLHFTFEWSNNNVFVGIFSPINESIWEHLKLIFFPMVIATIIVYLYEGKKVSNYLCAKTLGILNAIFFTIIFFYTYTGIIGTNFAFVDISIFFIAIMLGQYTSYKKMESKSYCNNSKAIIIFLLLFLCFLIFTFFPPHIGLFRDPLTGMYG